MGWIIAVILVGFMLLFIRYQTKKEPASLHMLYTQTTHKQEEEKMVHSLQEKEVSLEKEEIEEKKEEQERETQESISPIRIFLQQVEGEGLTKEEIEQAIDHKEMKEVVLAYHQLVQTKNESYEEDVQEWMNEMETKLDELEEKEEKEEKTIPSSPSKTTSKKRRRKKKMRN